MKVAKKLTIISIVVMLLFALCISSSIAINTENTNTTPEEAIFEEICFIPVGTDKYCVGYAPHPVEPGAPEGFIARPDGSICILDSVNYRIIITEEGKEPRYLNYGDVRKTYVRNFAYGDGKFYCLDMMYNTVFSIDEECGAVENVPMNANINLSVVSWVKYRDGSLEMEYSEMNTRTLETSLNILTVNTENGTVSSAKRDFSVNRETKGVNAVVDGKKYSIELKSSERQNFGIIDTYSDGSILTIVCEDAPGVDVIWTEDTFRTFDKNGVCTGYALLDKSEQFAFPYRNTFVDENDNTYYMTCESDGVHIYRIIFGKSYTSNMDEVVAQGKLLDEANDKLLKDLCADDTEYAGYQLACPDGCGETSSWTEGINSISLTRSQVQTRANQYRNMTWVLNAWNKNFTGFSDVTLPVYVQNASSGTTLTGMPYAWGKNDSIDGFRSKIAVSQIGEHCIAGNTNSTNALNSRIAGTDCSGFVGRVYGITEKKGTEHFYREIGNFLPNGTSPKLMDFYVKANHHIVLYVSQLGNNNTTIIDATTGSTNIDRVTQRNVTTSSYFSGYSAKTPWNVECTTPSSYSSNSTVHWKSCTDCGITVVPLTAHTPGQAMNGRVSCTVCGRVLSIVIEESLQK